MLVPRNGAMYQDPTEKNVETKREISQRTFTLLGGKPYPLFGGGPKKILVDPLFGGKMWPGQKNPSGPFIESKKYQKS